MSPDPTTARIDRKSIQSIVMRKVALRLVPFLMFAYFLNYLDRTNLSFAKLTMSAEIGLSETMFGLSSGLFFLGYVLLEVPSNLALYRFGARRWISRIMVSWGLVTMAMAFVNSPVSLSVLRFLLGVAEAGFFPGILLYLTFWFPRHVRVRLVGIFMLALPLSSAFGAPLSSAIIEYLDGALGFSGWQLVFLLQGLPTVLLGIVTWFYLTDKPREAKWLNQRERDWLEGTMAAEEHSVAESGHASMREGLKDVRVWGLGIVYFGLNYGMFALAFFLPTIVGGLARSFSTDFTLMQTGLISAVPFLFGAMAMMLWARHSDLKQERIWHVAAPVILSGISVPTALYMNSPLATMAVISLTAIGIYSAFPVFWSLPPSFLTGKGAAAGIAVVNTIGATAGIVSPYITGWLLDMTGTSQLGLWLVGGFELLAAAVLLALAPRLRASFKGGQVAEPKVKPSPLGRN
ncbi:MFS transporter [Paenarthrobacter sp. NPDC058040]|uniref:MFS transporter n=1 Tax=unclassified Paenarthrobacter TaxID=2634190 RepID=UPI0036DD6E55